MFGILYLLGVGIAAGISGINGDIANAQAKDRARLRNDPANMYIDRKGAYRDINTGAYRNITRDYGGSDRYLVDEYGNKLRNLSEEERIQDAAYRAAIAPEGTIAIRYADWYSPADSQLVNPNTRIDDWVCGPVFKDIVTGELYLKRRFILGDNGRENRYDNKRPQYPAQFYMKVSDATLVCPTEDTINRPNCPSKEILNSFMKTFNEAQQKEGGYQAFCLGDRYDDYFRNHDKKYKFKSKYLADNRYQ